MPAYRRSTLLVGRWGGLHIRLAVGLTEHLCARSVPFTLLPSGGPVLSRVGAGVAVVAMSMLGLTGFAPAAVGEGTGRANSGNMTVLSPTAHASTQALRSIPAQPVAAGKTGNFPHQPLPHRPSTATPTAAGSIQTSTSGTAPTATSFDGQHNVDAVLPPDTNGAVGGNWYVQWVNLHIGIYDRSGNLITSKPGNAIWNALGTSNLCATKNQGDPVVRYDQLANRWVLTQFAFSTNIFGNPVAPYYQCLAVSTTGDPTGSYNVSSWNVGHFNGADYFPDYPKLSVWPDGYYMSFNYFDSSLTTFEGSGAVVFDRNTLIGSSTATGSALATGPIGSTYGGLLPADLDGTSLPPTDGSGAYPNTYTAIDTNDTGGDNTLWLWKAVVHFGTTPSGTFGGTATCPIGATTCNTSYAPSSTLLTDWYDWYLCGGSRNCIPQKGTTAGLDTLSDRLMFRAAYRVVGGTEEMVLVHSVNTSQTGGTVAGIRWYLLEGLSGTPTLAREGTYAPGDGLDRWMPSAALDSYGDLAIGYSVSSSTMYPAIRYATATPSSLTTSTPFSGEQALVNGGGYQSSSSNRWGDYSAMTVDPSDDCTFWYTNEYYSASSSYGWNTRIGHFPGPSCPPPPAPGPFTVTAGTTTSTSVALSWTASSGATSYAVLRNGAQVGTTSNLSYTDTGLAPSTTYSYSVVASNGSGSTPSSNTVSGTTQAGPPAAPTGLTATAVSGPAVQLSWTGSAGATSYNIYRATSSSGPFASVGSTSSTSFTDTTVARRTMYWYYVTAFDSPYESSPSNTVSVKTARK
jgi:hypothetical protein